MSAPLKSIEGTSIAAAMADIGRRGKAAARALALSRRRSATRRSARWRARSATARRASSPPMPRTSPRRKQNGTTPAFLDRLSLDAEACRRDGRRHRGRARSRRPGRRRDGKLDAAERNDHRARAGAARRRRRDLREPPERDGGCGRALPQGGQRRDPARRLGELPLRARDPRGTGVQYRGRLLRQGDQPDAGIGAGNLPGTAVRGGAGKRRRTTTTTTTSISRTRRSPRTRAGPTRSSSSATPRSRASPATRPT